MRSGAPGLGALIRGHLTSIADVCERLASAFLQAVSGVFSSVTVVLFVGDHLPIS